MSYVLSEKVEVVSVFVTHDAVACLVVYSCLDPAPCVRCSVCCT